MGNRKRHRRKAKAARLSSSAQTIAFSATKHPFSGVPQDVLLDAIVKHGKAKAEEFPRRLCDVSSLLSSIDPLLALSSLSVYGLTGGVDEHGNISQSYKGERFTQSHVELAQALSLRTARELNEAEFPSPSDIQYLFDELPEVADAYAQRRFVQLEETAPAGERSSVVVQEWLRLHTQSVRNWGFLSRVASLIKALCAPIDDIFLEQAGGRASEMVDLFLHLIKRQERLINLRREKLRPVFRQKTAKGAIAAYYDASPHLVDSRDYMCGIVESNEVPLAQVLSMVLAHSDLSLAKDFTFSAEELALEMGIDAERVEQILSRLSLRFGDLATTESETLFLANPVWTRPVIRLSATEYFCVIPQVFFSFVFPILQELLQNSTVAAKRYSDRRAEFLEESVYALFEKAFPGCAIHKNVRWHIGDRQYETDLVAGIDSHLILVEAKSHAVSWAALRGAPERAKRHVKELLLGPSTQSLRLAHLIEQSIAGNAPDIGVGEFPINLSDIRSVLRLSVTLEDFATLQSSINQLKEVSWIPDDHQIAPCILLSDLEIVLDILGSKAEVLHYLRRRAELEESLRYRGDELDLLGLYLKTGFNLGTAEAEPARFMLLGMSKPIDAYYMTKEEGFAKKKPTREMTNWWRDICQRIEERSVVRWSEAVTILLSVSLPEQRELEKRFRRVIKNVKRNWRDENHVCSITLIPPNARQDAIALYAFREAAKHERYTRIENVVSNVFETSHAVRCLVIGVNVDTDLYPYALMAVYFRGE